MVYVFSWLEQFGSAVKDFSQHLLNAKEVSFVCDSFGVVFLLLGYNSQQADLQAFRVVKVLLASRYLWS